MSNNKDLTKELSVSERTALINALRTRFEKNRRYHKELDWDSVETRLDSFKIWSLNEMEKTGGEPDVIGMDQSTGEYLFCDCSTETPKGRRNVCYDSAGQSEREKHEIYPAGNAVEMAEKMGCELLDEHQYRVLQKLGEFDLKTSSWLKTPAEIRKLGGGIFGDRRYNTVFVYHNGAGSFYAARGFRVLVRV